MATQGILPKDANYIAAVGAVSSATDSGESIRPLQYNPTTRGLTVHIVGNDAGGATPTTVVAFVTTVTTAGTRVQLATNTVQGVILQAPSTNTGLIYVGGSNVSSSVFGAELQPGQSTSIAIDNTNKIWVDSSVNGDKVAILGS